MINDFLIRWAKNVLNDSGYQIHTSNPEVIQDTAWSKVYRFKTNQGFIFLKKVPPELSLEPSVINLLANQFHAHVPKITVVNQEHHCFLMRDAGIPLHYYFKENSFDAKIFIKVIHDYSTLQINSCDKINLFLDLGVPDWRLEKLPKLYQDLIAQEDFLIEDGLNKDELIKLNKLKPKLISICEQLSNYKIEDTFGHADFHDKNILIDTNTKHTTLIDLGEVVITHPFFSFLNCLYRAKENFGISNREYKQLQIACFKPWLTLETEAHLFEILELIQQCWSIHSVLGEFRLLNSIDQSDLNELLRQGRLANNLRYWLNQ